MHSLAPSVITALGMESPEFLQILLDIPENSEQLILHLLQLLTDNGTTLFILLVLTQRKTYSKTCGSSKRSLF